MSKTLIIPAHPDISQSTVNQQPRRKHRGTVLNVSYCMFS